MKAFPLNVSSQLAVEYGGMDLRDYFAAQAMPAVITKFNMTDIEISELAYQIADAMLHEREQGKELMI